MNAPKSLLKNLGAKLRLMMVEDWRGDDERNTLGMAGHWLEKLSEDQPKGCNRCGRELLPDLEGLTCVVCSESCQCIDRAAVYRDGIPWCINCHSQILSACESPPMGDAPCESRWNWNIAQSTTHAPDITEIRKDLKIALQWIDNSDDQEGRDLIVTPMMAKYSMQKPSCHDCRYCGDNRPEGKILCNHESWYHWDEEMRVFSPNFAPECASYEAKHSLHNRELSEQKGV